ncbi:unnamed protein product [Oikopleura dioica]|uniref:deoxyguanosine kinase n=1 Tax=Oikopleura dioica TaxID=34765 RepID=E4YUH2_OIKDI|nr:unnamed protein product [Oikopleura dioica]
MEPYTKRARKNPVRISIEGNIATGKSTFIKILEEAAGTEDWEITPEPVSTWTQIEGKNPVSLEGSSSGGNLLKLFYDDAKRWSYTFQSFALLSRMRLQRAPFKPRTVARLSERSIHSDRYIFARNCFETGLMTETEWSIYKDWSTYLLESLGDLQLDGFIYLRCDPKVCDKRMAKRGRPEEQGVTLEYLSQLHEKHEKWLHNREFHDEDIMQDIPILEIDCNEEFHDDEEIKSKMLQQVREFVRQVQEKRQEKLSSVNETDSGVDSYSRSDSPLSDAQSLSPLPFSKGVEDVANPVANVETIKTD